MAFDDFTHKGCTCDFVQNLGAFKATLAGLLDAAIAWLTVTKAAIMLWPADIGDQLKKIELEAQIAVLETAIGTMSAPFSMAISYMTPYAD